MAMRKGHMENKKRKEADKMLNKRFTSGKSESKIHKEAQETKDYYSSKEAKLRAKAREGADVSKGYAKKRKDFSN